MEPRTLYRKLWDAHVIRVNDDGATLLYIDRHLVHEVTSPQAFEGLKLAERRPRHPEATFAVPDHNVPTCHRELGIQDPIARLQVATLVANCREFGITCFGMEDIRHGIIHVMAPEQGITLPGLTMVCGDSHTATHGAFGALAFGIGTSEVEHVLATQTIWQKPSRTMLVRFEGALPPGVGPKDLVLHLIGRIGTAGGTGYVMEFAGPVVAGLSMEGRMTLCNMAIEAGARAGMVAVDQTTIDYVAERPYAPQGDARDAAIAAWGDLHSDPGALFDREEVIDASLVAPQVTWGTSPEMVVPVDGEVPDPAKTPDPALISSLERAMAYMGLQPGTPITAIPVDRVFIGSCTNGRLEDLRQAAAMIRGRSKAANIKEVLVVPGSGLVKQQAEAEGLDRIFRAAGFSWRDPGCSMCLAMNADTLQPGERCASTSNRNFEGRQGKEGRTHLVSPATAAATAIAGHFVDIRNWR